MNNDQKILELKKQIEEKKQKIGKISTFAPVTNCSLELDGVRMNIQALDKDQLTFLAVKLNSYQHSAIDLGVECMISGYNLSDWYGDVVCKISVLNQKDELASLKATESILTKLLSNDKKTELEIQEIERMLK